MSAATTEADTVAIVRKIMAAPTSAAFDTAAGAIIRLFAQCHALGQRIDRIGAELAECRQRLRQLEIVPIDAAPPEAEVTATLVSGHKGRPNGREQDASAE
jgi:hypothetical protein